MLPFQLCILDKIKERTRRKRAEEEGEGGGSLVHHHKGNNSTFCFPVVRMNDH